jgi:predicted PurR-regulated permease PerM
VTPAALKTILIDAPVMIDSVRRLIDGLRRLTAREQPSPASPVTLDSLRQDLARVEERLKANSDSDVEQLKLIEELARQNEALAASVARLSLRLTALMILAVVALFLSLFVLLSGPS